MKILKNTIGCIMLFCIFPAVFGFIASITKEFNCNYVNGITLGIAINFIVLH